MKKSVLLLVFLFLLDVSVALPESLEESFTSLCGQVENAQSLSVEDLKGLVAECDRLLAVLKERNERKDRTFLVRLQQCRNFYDYMAAVKEKPSR